MTQQSTSTISHGFNSNLYHVYLYFHTNRSGFIWHKYDLGQKVNLMTSEPHPPLMFQLSTSEIQSKKLQIGSNYKLNKNLVIISVRVVILFLFPDLELWAHSKIISFPSYNKSCQDIILITEGVKLTFLWCWYEHYCLTTPDHIGLLSQNPRYLN